MSAPTESMDALSGRWSCPLISSLLSYHRPLLLSSGQFPKESLCRQIRERKPLVDEREPENF